MVREHFVRVFIWQCTTSRSDMPPTGSCARSRSLSNGNPRQRRWRRASRLSNTMAQIAPLVRQLLYL